MWFGSSLWFAVCRRDDGSCRCFYIQCACSTMNLGHLWRRVLIRTRCRLQTRKVVLCKPYKLGELGNAHCRNLRRSAHSSLPGP